MAAGITLAKAISVFSRELGCGDNHDRDSLIDYITTSIEFLLFNGGGAILREWKLIVSKGKFTMPRDLSTPIKYKFGDSLRAPFGTFHSPYLTYSSQGIQTCCGFSDMDSKIYIAANKVATQYELPTSGVRLLATTRDERDVGKKIMVSGKRSGMDITPIHNNYKTAGELLTIYHEEDPEKRYGAYVFDEITAVVKDETCAYTMLSGIDAHDEFYHISHYHPDEIVPTYAEGIIHACPVNCCDFILHILGRVNPSIRYIRDEDILPIQSLEMLGLLAKRARHDESGNYNEVSVIEARIANLIRKIVAYQQASVRQMSFNMKSFKLTTV